MMDNVHIRPFRYSDIDALVQIATIAFAEEMRAQGMTPEGFIGQVRMIMRGRMIPFRLVTAIAGIHWEMFVAEVDGQVVGCGGYVGRRHIDLGNLMVVPDYRRQGIGQKLLEYRLKRLTDLGYERVTTMVLAGNEASLGNLRKQGFELFDEYTVLETGLPWSKGEESDAPDIVVRPVTSSDRHAFERIESQTVNPASLQLQGSSWPHYSPSPIERVLNRFIGAQRWSRTFEQARQTVGFLLASSSRNQRTGFIARPVISDEHLQLTPALTGEMMSGLAELGKSKVQIAIPTSRVELIEILQEHGWVPTHTWYRLVKWLNGRSQSSS